MLDQLECPVCPELSTQCRKLLSEYSFKPLDLEFEVRLCEIAASHKECIEEYRWRAEPTAPQDYVKYQSFSPKDRAIYLDQHPLFLTQGKCAEYLNNRDMINNRNKRNLDILKFWMKLPVIREVTEDPQVGITLAAHAAVCRIVDTYSGRGVV